MTSEVRPQPWKGVAAALVAAAVLTALASVMPAAVRKLILFAVAFGMGIGGVVAFSAGQFDTSRRIVLTLVPLLTIAGLSFIAQRTRREYQALQHAADIENPQSSMPSPMLEAIAADDPQTAEMLNRERTRQPPDFLQYLAVRTRPLGEWPHPWPALFWVGELLLACVAGVIVARRVLQRLPEPVPTHESIEKDTLSP